MSIGFTFKQLRYTRSVSLALQAILCLPGSRCQRAAVRSRSDLIKLGRTSDMEGYLAVILTLAVSGVRLGMGLFKGITGPTMLYLAANVDSTIGTVSYMFIGRAVGIVIGAVSCGFIKRFYPKSGQLSTLGLAVAFLGVTMFLVPWISSLWVLIVDLGFAGIMYGYLDAGFQALLLQIWGDVKSRVHIQLFHFTFVLGATFAPLIVKPFTPNEYESGSKNARCHSGGDDADDASNTTAPPMLSKLLATQESILKHEREFNPVGWSYVISACWLLMMGTLVIILAKCSFEKKMSGRSKREESYYGEQRTEEPLCDVIWILLPTIGYFFCSVATENVFYNYIYSITVCSGLQFTVAQATLANSLTWIGLAVGRLLGILVSKFFTPRTIIIASIAGSIVDSLVMTLFGLNHVWISWSVSFLHGLTTSVMFPSGVSWISEVTNVSITYMSIFSIGVFLATSTMLPLAGYIFYNYSPFGVVMQCFVLAAVNATFYGVAVCVGNRHKNNLKRTRLTSNGQREEMKKLFVQD